MINYFETREYVEQKIEDIKACIKDRENQIEELEERKESTRKPALRPRYDNDIFRLNDEIYMLNKELDEYEAKLNEFGRRR